MDWKLGGLILLLVPGFASAQVYGQDRPDPAVASGGNALGRLIGGLFRRGPSQREVDLYNEQMQQSAEAASAYWGAREARSNALLAEAEAEVRTVLTKSWHDLGLSDSEARSVAAAFSASPEQGAINERIVREGWRNGVTAALDAYRRYDYPMANKLLLGAVRAMPDASPSTPPQPPPASDCEACKRIGSSLGGG